MSNIRSTFFQEEIQPENGEYYGWYCGECDERFGCVVYLTKNNKSVKITFVTKRPGNPYTNDYNETAIYMGVIKGQPLFGIDPDPITALYKN